MIFAVAQDPCSISLFFTTMANPITSVITHDNLQIFWIKIDYHPLPKKKYHIYNMD